MPLPGTNQETRTHFLFPKPLFNNYKIYTVLFFLIKDYQYKTAKNVSAHAGFTGNCVLLLTATNPWVSVSALTLPPSSVFIKAHIAQEKRSKLVGRPFNDCQAAEEHWQVWETPRFLVSSGEPEWMDVWMDFPFPHQFIHPFSAPMQFSSSFVRLLHAKGIINPQW